MRNKIFNYITIAIAIMSLAACSSKDDSEASSLRITNSSGDDIDSLHFGSDLNVTTANFNIVNDGSAELTWDIVESSDWIISVSKTSGTLQPGKKHGVTVTIDRDLLEGGENVTTLNVNSDAGSKEITVSASVTNKLVKILSLDDMDGSNTESWTFTYDNQERIADVTYYSYYYGDGELHLTYSGNRITQNNDGYLSYLTLDENGYWTQYDDEYGDRPTNHEYYNGYASKSVGKWEDEDEEFEIIYNWDNGNLVGIDEEFKSMSSEYTNYYSESYTYGNVNNRLNIDLSFILSDSMMAHFLKFKGRYSKNYPLTISDGDDVSTLSYTFDNAGYPTEIVVTQQDGDGYIINLIYY
jgi:hypothetical protein